MILNTFDFPLLLSLKVFCVAFDGGPLSMVMVMIQLSGLVFAHFSSWLCLCSARVPRPVMPIFSTQHVFILRFLLFCTCLISV